MSDQLLVDADLLSIRAIGPWLRDVLAGPVDAGTLDAFAARCELALQEIAANIVNHGYADVDDGADATIEISGEIEGDGFVVRIIDRGAPYAPDEQPSPDPDVPQVHGYGLMIVRQLTRRFEHHRTGDANLTLLEFALPDPPLDSTSISDSATSSTSSEGLRP